MLITITLFNQKFETAPPVKKQIQEYLSLIEDNYDAETATDLKVSFAENLNSLSSGKEITKEILDQVVAKIGSLEKPIYKSFYRYRGVFGGVCDGIATYFNISIWWPRLLFGFPFIFGILLFVDAFIYTVFPSLPFSTHIFWNVNFNSDANTEYGYQIRPFAEFLADISFNIIIIYILAWLFTPKANKEFDIKKLKSKWEYSDELEKAIFNKVTFRTPLIRKLVTNLFLNIAKFGVFAFDVTISIVNNLFTSIIFTTLLWLAISIPLIMGLFYLLFIAVKF